MIASIVCAQNTTSKDVDITSIFSYDQFEETKKFILKEAPYNVTSSLRSTIYRFQCTNTDIEVRLASIVRFPAIESTMEEMNAKMNNPKMYDAILLMVFDKDGNSFYRIKQDTSTHRIYLEPDTQESLTMQKEQVRGCLNCVLEEITKKQ
ncbi:hypothetical protein [Dysgonomonas sp. HGC4]|uniref:hypothetical protein n=1 Tax=Dysgonomonas sp. HGC4 TaxID=1658009 RepID=UPI0012FBB378|nr:hypothetical protein [Dysgonomonas sp. HGC4]MBD8349279.1 hypothetical protein [Dysgonomonas sp. HGC4]